MRLSRTDLPQRPQKRIVLSRKIQPNWRGAFPGSTRRQWTKFRSALFRAPPLSLPPKLLFGTGIAALTKSRVVRREPHFGS